MVYKVKKIQKSNKKDKFEIFHGLLNNLYVPFIPENYPFIEKVNILSKSKKDTVYNLSCEELEYARDTDNPILNDMQLDYINLILTKKFIKDILVEFEKLL